MADGTAARVHLPLVAESYAPPVRVRARTVSMSRFSHRELARGRAQFPEMPGVDYTRPRTLADCEAVGLGDWQPCPFVSCKHHLYLDVNEHTGSIKLNFPDRDPDELTETCSLHVARRGGVTLEETGELLAITRERTRQLETMVLGALREELALRALDADDLTTEDP